MKHNEVNSMSMDEKTLSEIIQRLTRIEVKLEEIIQVKKEIISLREEVDLMQKEVIALQTKQEQQRKELDLITENNKWISRAVIGAVISSLVAIVFAILKLGLGI